MTFLSLLLQTPGATKLFQPLLKQLKLSVGRQKDNKRYSSIWFKESVSIVRTEVKSLIIVHLTSITSQCIYYILE